MNDSTISSEERWSRKLVKRAYSGTLFAVTSFEARIMACGRHVYTVPFITCVLIIQMIRKKYFGTVFLCIICDGIDLVDV